MKIEKLPLAKIRENSYNPNEMPPALFESLVASIRDHGYVQPIIVRRVGEGYEVVDGAHRLRALKKLGRALAECVVVEDDANAAKLRTLTMNRLRGRMDNFDVAKILEGFRPESIERYLAFGEKERLELKTLLAKVPELNLPELKTAPMPVVVEFLLPRKDAAQVEAAIRAVDGESRNRGLLAICRFYLDTERESQS